MTTTKQVGERRGSGAAEARDDRRRIVGPAGGRSPGHGRTRTRSGGAAEKTSVADVDQGRYEAVRSRDSRFDGVFFAAVTSTGIYCRPSCPATTPKRENVRFFPSAAAAQGAGFRACRRCRPDAVPGSAEWNARADAVGRAMRLIGDGVIDREGVAGLAARLGYSPRQVQRLLNAEVGAGPIALARAQRAHTARVLLRTTDLPATDVAFAAGFASVRQFNDTIRMIYAATPSELRGRRPPRGPSQSSARSGAAALNGDEGGRSGGGGVRSDRAIGTGAGGLVLRLGYRRPYAVAEIFDHLGCRVIRGVEEMRDGPGGRTYRRTLRLPRGSGVVEVAEVEVAEQGAQDPGWLRCRLSLTDLRDLTTAVTRIRRLFDLDADPAAVAERLGADPVLAPLVAARPGLRAAGTVDPHELAVRAVLGQQVSVRAGRRLGDLLVVAHGEPLPQPDGGLTHLFPRADDLAAASLAELGMPRSRRATLRSLAAALATGTVGLDVGADRDEATGGLLALPGIGPWTAGYIRMRALGDPDVFLDGDAALRAACRRAGVGRRDAASWAPWRTYATYHLWRLAATDRAPSPSGRSAPTPPVPPVPPARPGRLRAHPGRDNPRQEKGRGPMTLTMAPTVYTTMPSPVGDLLLVGTVSRPAPAGIALASLSMPEQRGGATVDSTWRRAPGAFTEVVRQVEEYLAGERRTFELVFATRGTDFQERVWRALDDIPYGTTTSYGTLATRIGVQRRAVRAVAASIGANPLPLVRPCHRVIGADGDLRGFAAGRARKEWLLRHEGALPPTMYAAVPARPVGGR